MAVKENVQEADAIASGQKLEKKSKMNAPGGLLGHETLFPAPPFVI